MAWSKVSSLIILILAKSDKTLTCIASPSKQFDFLLKELVFSFCNDNKQFLNVFILDNHPQMSR